MCTPGEKVINFPFKSIRIFTFPPPPYKRCESVVSVSQPVAGRLPTDDTGPPFPPSASLALKDQVQNEDDDDGKDDYHSGAEAQNMFNLKQKSRFMYLRSACVFNLAAMSAKMFSVLSLNEESAVDIIRETKNYTLPSKETSITFDVPSV